MQKKGATRTPFLGIIGLYNWEIMREHKVMAIITLKFTDHKQLMTVASKQIPFAIASTLTKLAKQAQADVREHIEQRFIIRKRAGGFTSSIRIKPATKQSLVAKIYSMARFASLQQVGGAKQARVGRLAIPLYDKISDVKRRTAKNSPASLLASGAFITRTKNGEQMIARRNKASSKLNFLYLLRKNADVQKRFEMIETVEQTVQNNFAFVFGRALV